MRTIQRSGATKTMCGIAGFLRAAGVTEPGDPAILRAMAASIRHRGPDDEDVWHAGGVGLAHRRLAVIDPAPHGRQPMTRGDGRWTITFNGEIYNYKELRRELEAEGELFQTQSDTEVLLAALVRWGVQALNRLNGMYAFAFWDARERRLLLARDRIGKKPLYYAQAGDTLVFGSEIKAVLAWPGLERRPNLEAIHHYLAMQYVPSPFTAFEGIERLPPGSFAEVRPGVAPVVTRYWGLPSPAEVPPVSKFAIEELAEQARDLLEASVRRRMVADVPVGAFLSGGVDSSAVTAMMAMQSSRPVKTFSIGFDHADYDERKYARMVAQRYSTDHHEEVVQADASQMLPDLVWHYGEPFADSSALPTFHVSRLARQHVTVALSGDGGDEFFLGYQRYGICADMAWIDRVPGFARDAAKWTASAIPSVLASRRYIRGARRLLQYVSSSGLQRYEPMMMFFQEGDKLAAYGEQLQPYAGISALNILEPYFQASSDMAVGAAWADIHTYLPDDLLVKVDVASMAFGLECRAPFLDVELMEWAARVPASAKMPGGALKGLLKKAVEPLLPAEIINRPKLGFGAPIEPWLKRDLFDLAEDVLTDPRAESRNLFRSGYAAKILKEHRDGVRLHHTRIWAMLMLELWFQTWIDPPVSPTAAPTKQNQ